MVGWLPKPVTPVLQIGHPLANGLVLAMPFADNSGTGQGGFQGHPSGVGALVRDYSGYRNHGTIINAADWQAGPFGSSIQTGVTFSTQYLELANTPSLDFGGPNAVLTISAWFRTTQSSGATLFSAYQSASPFHGYGMGLNVASTGSVDFYSDTAAWNGVGVGANDGKWHNFILSYQARGGTNDLQIFYFDGKQVGFAFGHSVFTPSGQVRWVGNGRNGSNQLLGNIDGLTIWNRALSLNEVSQVYADPFAIYRKPSRWWETAAAAPPPAFVPYNPWPQQAPVLAQ